VDCCLGLPDWHRAESKPFQSESLRAFAAKSNCLVQGGPVFELLEEGDQRTFRQKLAYLLISLASHVAVLGLCVIIPLFFLKVSSENELLAFLIDPPPPPSVIAPPPPPPMNFGRAVWARTFAIPESIPNFIAPPIDEPNPVEALRGFFSKRLWEPGKVSGWPVELSSTNLLTPSLPVAPTPPRPIRRAPIRVGGNVQEAKILIRILPVYPEIARTARISGIVVLQAIIDEDGRVESIEVLEGHPILAQAAVEAVKQWQYSPTMLNGEPLPVTAVVTVIFSLK
jgi:periplasmic protein TonB